MTRVATSLALVLMLAACSPPVKFKVEVDEPIEGGTLTLAGISADLTKKSDGAYWAEWDGSDAAGEIELRYPDGGKVTCVVGYVTNGMQETQEFTVTKRRCRDLSFDE